MNPFVIYHLPPAGKMSVFLRFAIVLFALPLLAGDLYAQEYFKNCAFKTGRSANLIVPASIKPSISGQPMVPGTEIAVFSPDGVCAGVVVWKDKNVAMTIWGNDMLSSAKDGMDSGDVLHFYLWDPEQEKLYAGPDLVSIELDTSRPYYRNVNRYDEGAIYRLVKLNVDTRHAVDLVAPRDGIEVPDRELKLSWNPMQGASTYRVQVSTDLSFNVKTFDHEVSGASATIEVEDGQTYFWRVGVSLDDDRVAWSETYSFVTGLGANKGSHEMINGFLLEQNYPNPFNPSTTIPFHLEDANDVTLRVYNMLGQEVATLVDGFTPAGSHEARWDAGDLPSGMYLYRLIVDRYVQTKTLTFIK